MKTSMQKTSIVVLLSMVALPGCNPFKQEEKKSDVAKGELTSGDRALVNVGDKPVLTEKEFEDFLAQAAEADPQVKFMLSYRPEFTREQILKAKKRSAVISAWAEHQGVHKTEDYKKKEQQIVKQVREALDNESFLQHHKVDVSDSEVRKFYEESKAKDPRLLKAAGGVKAIGVSFDNKDAAAKFLEKVKAHPNNIELIATTLNLQAKNFGLVNQDSMLDAALRKGIDAIKSTPSATMIHSENKFWVVAALSKEKTSYYSFDEVKEGIKRMLLPKKMEEMLDAELPKYEKKFGVTENVEYLKELQQKSEERERATQQEAAKAQQQQTAQPTAA